MILKPCYLIMILKSLRFNQLFKFKRKFPFQHVSQELNQFSPNYPIRYSMKNYSSENKNQNEYDYVPKNPFEIISSDKAPSFPKLLHLGQLLNSNDILNNPLNHTIFISFCESMDNILIEAKENVQFIHLEDQKFRKMSFNHSFTNDTINKSENITFALGLSGGSDSVALFILLYYYTQLRGYELNVCVIDHNLRQESSLECNAIHHWLSELQTNHTIYKLNWTKEDMHQLQTKSQLICRLRRQEIFKSFSRNNNVNFFCTAHHLNDQIETFLYRWSKSSHLNGLAGMKSLTPIFIRDLNNKYNIEEHIYNFDNHLSTINHPLEKNYLTKNNLFNFYLTKPLLQITKQELRNFIQNCYNWNHWVEDPTNYNINKDTRAFLRKVWKEKIEFINQSKNEISNGKGIENSLSSNSNNNIITEHNFIELFKVLKTVNDIIETSCIEFISSLPIESYQSDSTIAIQLNIEANINSNHSNLQNSEHGLYQNHSLIISQFKWNEFLSMNPYTQSRVIVHIIRLLQSNTTNDLDQHISSDPTSVSKSQYQWNETPLYHHINRMKQLKSCNIGNVMFQFCRKGSYWKIFPEDRIKLHQKSLKEEK